MDAVFAGKIRVISRDFGVKVGVKHVQWTRICASLHEFWRDHPNLSTWDSGSVDVFQ